MFHFERPPVRLPALNPFFRSRKAADSLGAVLSIRPHVKMENVAVAQALANFLRRILPDGAHLPIPAKKEQRVELDYAIEENLPADHGRSFRMTGNFLSFQVIIPPVMFRTEKPFARSISAARALLRPERQYATIVLLRKGSSSGIRRSNSWTGISREFSR